LFIDCSITSPHRHRTAWTAFSFDWNLCFERNACEYASSHQRLSCNLTGSLYDDVMKLEPW